MSGAGQHKVTLHLIRAAISPSVCGPVRSVEAGGDVI